MIDPNSDPDTPAENALVLSGPDLCAALVREESLAHGALDVLPSLLNGGQGLLGQDVVARVTGMVASLAGWLSGVMAREPDASMEEAIRNRLYGETRLLAHLQALALEFRIAQRLSTDYALDPIAPPAFADWAGSGEQRLAAVAAEALGAQARFCGQMMRMELPAGELPAPLFHLVTRDSEAAAGQSFPHDVRATYDEGRSRLTILDKLATALHRREGETPDCRRHGLALFLSRLCIEAGIARERLVASIASGEGLCLALGLRASGLGADEAAGQFALLVRDGRVQPGIWDISAADARSALDAANEGAQA